MSCAVLALTKRGSKDAAMLAASCKTTGFHIVRRAEPWACIEPEQSGLKILHAPWTMTYPHERHDGENERTRRDGKLLCPPSSDTEPGMLKPSHCA